MNLLLNNFSIFCMSNRYVYRWLHYLVQTIMLLLIMTEMIIWSVVLVNLIHEINVLQGKHNLTSADELLVNVSPNNLTLSIGLTWRNIRILLITNILFPEFFAFVAVLAVSGRSFYWCLVSGNGLFILWLFDHQRYPSLYSAPIVNSFQSLFVTGHVLHLIIWILVLLYGGALFTRANWKRNKLARLTRQHLMDISWNFTQTHPGTLILFMFFSVS